MRFSLRTKLFGAFGVVIVLMVVLEAVAISKLGSVNQEADYLGTKSVQSALTTATVRSATANIRRIQNRLIFAEPGQREGYFEKMKPFQQQLDQLLADYPRYIGDRQDRAMYEATKSAWQTYQEETTQFDERITAGDIPGAKKVLTESEKEFDALADGAGKWRDYNVKLAGVALKSSRDTYASARTTVITLLVVAALLAFFIARAITGGVGQMLKAAQGIADGTSSRTSTSAARTSSATET
jgi:methyl-accepting chemotaxis protein